MKYAPFYVGIDWLKSKTGRYVVRSGNGALRLKRFLLYIPKVSRQVEGITDYVHTDMRKKTDVRLR